MRRLSLCSLALAMLLSLAIIPSAPRAGTIPLPGPNPNWTEMQTYEWYIGFLARASQICRAYGEAAVLSRLARMSPYGAVGFAQNPADGFLGNGCVRLRDRAAEMVADAAKIEDYIEATYNCSDDGCFGQSLDDWQFHACGNSLKSHFAILDIDDKNIRAVTMLNPSTTGSKAAHQARVQFHSCQGSLYIDLTEQCIMEKTQTRGDCAFDGIERY